MYVFVRHLMITAIALCLHYQVQGQLPGAVTTEIGKAMPKPVGLSPNSASLGLYGSYSVSHYTGVPEISIPIYEITSGGLKVPVTLNYHAAGIRMVDNASWVGLGWSLSAGGQVTRQLRGDLDELTYFTDPLIENPVLCGPSGNWSYISNAESGVIDTQPDIFSYGFPGYSGSFMLGHSGESPYLIPYEPIKITHNGINATGDFNLNNFQITGSDGVIYRFGESLAGQPARETTTVDRNPFYPQAAVTSWLLTDIRSGNSNDHISFNYQSVGFATTLEPRTTITVLDNCVGVACPPHGPNLTSYGFNRSDVNQLGVKDISFPGGKVRFVLGPKRLDLTELNQLDSIKIYSEVAGTYTLLRSIKFNYSYFGYLTQPSAKVKLKLDKVDFIGSNGKVDHSYSFEYHTNGFSWNEGNQYSKDFWGYYNGKPNGDLIPAQTIQYTENNTPIQQTVTIGSADRSTVTTYMKEGVLKRIHFPTGGYTQFDFESHRYMEENVSQVAGGLRVKEIKTFESPNATPRTKTYVYGSNESGNGVKNFYNSLLYYKSESAIHDICCFPTVPALCPQGGNTYYRQRTYFGNSMLEIGSNDGSPVVYPVVTEYYGDVSTNIGKIIYEYDNGTYLADSLQIILGAQSSKNFKSDYSWRRGKPTKKTVKGKNGLTLSETITTYELYQKTKKHVGTAVERVRTYTHNYICYGDCNNEFGNPIDVTEFAWTRYYQMSGALRETSVVEKVYEYGNQLRSLVTSSTATYDALYLQPTRVVQSGSTDSEEIVKTIKYPYSYAYSGLQMGTARAMQTLLEKNMISTPIEEYTTRRDISGANERLIGGKLTVYKIDPNNSSFIVPDSVFMIETVSALPINAFVPSNLINSSSLKKCSLYKNGVKYLSFDGKGHLAEVKKENDFITSYLWGYRNTIPIAEVVNADLDLLPDAYTDLLFEAGTSFTTNITSESALNPTFTIGFEQLVQFSVNFFHAGGIPPGVPPTLDLVLKKSDGTIAFNPSVYNYGIYTSSFVLTPGLYTFYYTGSANSTPPDNIVTARFLINLNYQSRTNYNSKVFHSSFEETGLLLNEAKTGARVNSGSFNVPLPSAAGRYWLTWWQKTGSAAWLEQRVLVTTPYLLNGVQQTTYTIGSGTNYVDEVRLYPERAWMTTYTFDPILGQTSSTDKNNKTVYYSYDPMGRLKTIKDDKGNLVINKAYHFKTANP